MTLDRMKLYAQTVRDNISIMEECKEPDDAGYYLQLEHEKFILSCIEKQIPKKPKVIFDEYSYFECGNCGEAIYCTDDLKTHKYCLNCGQALDWSDTE